MSRFRCALSLLLTLSAAPIALAQEAPLRPDQLAFRGLYKELVETNTQLSSGDCTVAAQRMAARLKAAGYPDADVQIFTGPGHPKEGGLVAVYPGSDPKAKAILLLAHIDVVEAKRADWKRDPFTLIEEGGYFYARGSSDDKSQAAIWTDSMIRFRQEGFHPRRTIKLALTCGEETASAFNGANYLATQRHELLDAAFALNEGGGGREDAAGKPLWLNLQVGEKLYQDYNLEVTNPGGHSARPIKDNAITALSAGLVKIGAYDFPVQLSDTTRAFFIALIKTTPPATSAALAAMLKNPDDAQALAVVTADPEWNSTLRTTCVATMVDAGHAVNALPQRASANVNCRVFPGTTAEQVRAKLEAVVADPRIKVTAKAERSKPGPMQSLDPLVVGPAVKLAAEMFPGAPIIPVMSVGGTDGSYLTPTGIPTYGVPGILKDADGNGVHGLDERIRVSALYKGRDYVYRLVKLYADEP